MATLRNRHTAKIVLPAGEGYPKGGIMPPNSITEVPDEYIDSIKDNPSVRIYTKAGHLEIESPVIVPDPVVEPPASALGQAAAAEAPVLADPRKSARGGKRN